MLLKLNQSRVWAYMHHLVDALNARNAELQADAQALEAKVALLEAAAVAAPARAARAAREAQEAPMGALLARLEGLEAEVAASRALGTAVLLCAAGAAMAAAGASWLGGPRLRGLRRLVMLLAVCSGAAGLGVSLTLVRGAMLSYGETATVFVAQALRHAPSAAWTPRHS